MAWGEEEREYSIFNSQELILTAYHVKMYLEEILVLSFRLSDFIGWQLRCYLGVYRCCLKFSKKLTLSVEGTGATVELPSSGLDTGSWA